MVKGLTGCGLHGYSLVSFLVNRSVQYSWFYFTADILTEYQLQPPLDMVTVDQERELHKPNS